jgi:8-oxo-dGTP pyrophosphatase MutT (NUDIX family)
MKKTIPLRRKVQCWIFSQDGNCLLLKTNAKRGSFWQPVTGSVEEGESFSEGALREAIEETGFTFQSSPLDTGFTFDFDSKFGAATEHVFALLIKKQPKPKLDPKEHDAFRWVSPNDALKLLKFPSNAEGLKKALAFATGKETIGS